MGAPESVLRPAVAGTLATGLSESAASYPGYIWWMGILARLASILAKSLCQG